MLLPECRPECADCQEMKAGEWQYLCAAHPSPQPCSAIDYIIHTLDSTTALLNNTKLFPSRIFAHAWFHHRLVFDEFENETHLYKRFLYLSTIEFQLVPDKLVTIPDVFDLVE
ncbi:Mob1/phocein [Obelidium mucronatum]|nr:Mob1/phocein [Obelidium mucronatum]